MEFAEMEQKEIQVANIRISKLKFGELEKCFHEYFFENVEDEELEKDLLIILTQREMIILHSEDAFILKNYLINYF